MVDAEKKKAREARYYAKHGYKHQSAYYARNREKILAKQAAPEKRATHYAVNRKYLSKNREKSRLWSWKANGIPTPTRPEPEACESCGRPAVKTLHVDHDHATGKFRGWLCLQCNCALGLAGDNLEGVLNLAVYLSQRG